MKVTVKIQCCERQGEKFLQGMNPTDVPRFLAGSI